VIKPAGGTTIKPALDRSLLTIFRSKTDGFHERAQANTVHLGAKAGIKYSNRDTVQRIIR